MKKNNRIVITPGEPAGIGPDLVIKLAQYNWPLEIVVCSNASLLERRASLLGLPLKILPYIKNKPPIAQDNGTITLIDMPLYNPVVPGVLDPKNSQHVMNSLIRACNGCHHKEFAALVTGPVHKGVMNNAKINFLGHTEFLKKHTQSTEVVMMFVTKMLKVAVATTHLPIKKVASAITKNLLYNVINVLYLELQAKFNIISPHLLICGLNPHAGEDGYIGTEERDIIIPVIKTLKEKGLNLSGPLSADTIFQQKYLNKADAVLAMYHDQGLLVPKYQDFTNGVNITLGLPFVRTSVNHGTALNLAGKNNQINLGSFISALNLAINITLNNHD